jgi:hypothetical protein
VLDLTDQACAKQTYQKILQNKYIKQKISIITKIITDQHMDSSSGVVLRTVTLDRTGGKTLGVHLGEQQQTNNKHRFISPCVCGGRAVECRHS